MDIKKYITTLGFLPKNGTSGIYHKVYSYHDNYVISINFNTEHIEYGDKIIAESRTTQNFSQPENFVVLECVDRLLTKGYKPQNIVLEKTWPSGHGTSGRLDICINREDGTPYMLIECKTYGKEYNKESAKIHKDGGQLFTYFQLSGGKADVIMLYASELKDNKIIYVNEIIKIEDDYRSGDVKDIYEKWNKLTKDNGIFDSWVQPYSFQSKALTKDQLKEITNEDSSFIFNRFQEILRHHVVSDKGNAFNKIFTLFLCKVYDETTTDDDKELRFQWFEGRDDNKTFQLRLTDLYRDGMNVFLNRQVSDFDKEDFEKRFQDDEKRQYMFDLITKLRLEKNNEFAIKEVYDESSFEENAKVVKEVVELLQGYRIRYNKRQQYLSDFFELLLTTGLKQEAGQYFTPVPIAQFIIRSLPLNSIILEKLTHKDGEILPYMIDYAAGSGHFITEYMHEAQSVIKQIETSKYNELTKREIKTWQDNDFCWATKYVYGIEKDYRLVKVGKVGCYLHGDGLANVILSDGLANFYKNKDYKEDSKLRKLNNDGKKDNQQFDILLSNPPYSVPSFRQTTRNYYTEQDFELYDSLTDNSSEIECLFVERTKQLLKDGGVAGVILPSSILSNGGIYTKAREIILQYFDIVAIAELGSNTFMATNTNTVALFLIRRDNYFAANTRSAVETYFRSLNDVTINGIETPASKYVAHVWEGLEYSDYVTLLQKSPNDKVKSHDIYTEYKQKISAKTEAKFWEILLGIEAEKLLYFILAYPQKVVIVKSGEKDIEKHFLGYEFSNRRGCEGIHAIQKGKNIDECTKLFDVNSYDNPEKASTYIYRAFRGDYSSEIAKNMQQHISRVSLIDILTFDRDTFEKNLSLVAKKKVNYELVWRNQNLKILGEIADIQKGTSITKEKTIKGNIPVIAGGKDIAYYHNVSNRDGDIITISASGAYSGFVNYFSTPIFASDCNTVKSKDEDVISTKLIYVLLQTIQSLIYDLQKGQAQPHVYGRDISNIKIPVPPIDVQRQIIREIGKIDETANDAKLLIETSEVKIEKLLSSISYNDNNINEVAPFVTKSIKYTDIASETYITTNNMLQNKWGVVPFEGEANISSITEYKKDDILISNIRPYLKKIWFADKEGGCSKDVLVLRSADRSKYLPKYIFYMLRRDAFFDYVMEGKKGIKMPRGNKEDMMKYKIPVPHIDEQKRIVVQIEALELEITKARKLIENVALKKQAILDKYL